MSAAEGFGAASVPIAASKMFNAARPTVTLLVEGAADRAFWRIHAHCRIETLGGRPRVLEKLDQAEGEADAVLLGVLDADLDRLEGTLPERADVVWTDAHDLEGTLLGLPALEKLARGVVGAEALSLAEARWGEPLRMRLFRHAQGLGRLRWWKVRQAAAADEAEGRLDGPELVFKKAGRELQHFDGYDRCCEPGWLPAILPAIQAIINYSSAQKLKAEKLAEALAALPEAPLDQLCNGHDLIGFLRVGLEALKGKPGNADQLTNSLSLACEAVWLADTEMWRHLRAWEATHPGFRILIAEPDRPT